MVSAAALSGDGRDERDALITALRLPLFCQLWHPGYQRYGNFRGGFGQQQRVPVGGVTAGFPVYPPGFRQHPQ